MTFDDLLDRLWFFDAECFAHDCLFVFMNYRTKERVVFHNCSGNDIQEWIDKDKPILCGYNSNSYDKYILKAWLYGMTPEEIKSVNDYIINGGNGWELDLGYTPTPTVWDLLPCIIPRKSLKELEGNIGLNITETTVPFDLPTKWTQEQYEEVLYYCTCDVEALFPIFDMLIKRYKSKFIIAKLGNMDCEKALAMTDANLTATLLGGEKKEHNDNFAYVYPDVVDKNKIPKEVLNYIDDVIVHNDLEYTPESPQFYIDDCLVKVGLGGLHGAKETTFIYGKDEVFRCE